MSARHSGRRRSNGSERGRSREKGDYSVFQETATAITDQHESSRRDHSRYRPALRRSRPGRSLAGQDFDKSLSGDPVAPPPQPQRAPAARAHAPVWHFHAPRDWRSEALSVPARARVAAGRPGSYGAVSGSDSSEGLMELHRQVSGATGVGESTSTTSPYLDNKYDDDDDDDEEEATTAVSTSSSSAGAAGSSAGYLLVTGEDTVRGLHLDGLDVVLVAGRPNGPDEYTHIAGRTGRAGLAGQCICIVDGEREADKLVAWENMLGVRWERYGEDDAGGGGGVDDAGGGGKEERMGNGRVDR